MGNGKYTGDVSREEDSSGHNFPPDWVMWVFEHWRPIALIVSAFMFGMVFARVIRHAA